MEVRETFKLELEIPLVCEVAPIIGDKQYHWEAACPAYECSCKALTMEAAVSGLRYFVAKAINAALRVRFPEAWK